MDVAKPATSEQETSQKKREMSQPRKAASLLHAGHDPVSIADEMCITLQSVLGYLDRAIGEGLARRSDIYFSVPAPKRANPPTKAYEKVLKRYKNGAAAYGDMYDDLRTIEVGLHRYVRAGLEAGLGTGEHEWWRAGVPENVRVRCAERRERDAFEYCEAYCYTTFIDLASILEKSWRHLESGLPETIRSDRPRLLRDLRRLNAIRNKVMHPIKDRPPTEEDFEQVRELRSSLASILGQ